MSLQFKTFFEAEIKGGRWPLWVARGLVTVKAKIPLW
jgi:hypothetical protein